MLERQTEGKVPIICPKHGEFWQLPYAHLKGQGCVAERKANAHNKRKKISTKDFIEKATSVHGNKYNYSKVEYINPKTKVNIKCSIHGDFLQLPYAHLNGQGCPKCGKEKLRKLYQFSNEEFIKKAKEIHGDRYDYSKVNYVNYSTKVCIICHKHGEFWQTPSCHFKTEGCPTCKGELSISKEENDFSNFIKHNYDLLILFNDRKQIAPMELDAFLPFENIAFEYNGLYWHISDKIDKHYHLRKTELCEKQHIKLYHIFEDEWLNKRNLVEAKIKSIFGIYDKTIDSKDCLLKEVSTKETKQFIFENSLKENIKSTYKIGLYYKDELVSLMCFNKRKDNFELICFENKINVNIIGGAKLILNYFIEKFNSSEIRVKCDRRWNEGKIYESLGFKFEKYSKPNRYFIDNGKRIKNKINKINHQIFDCGNSLYLLKKISIK